MKHIKRFNENISSNINVLLRKAVDDDNLHDVKHLIDNGADITQKRFYVIRKALINMNVYMAYYLLKVAVRQMEKGKYDIIDEKTGKSIADILFDEYRVRFNSEWLNNTLDWVEIYYPDNITLISFVSNFINGLKDENIKDFSNY